MASRAMPPSLRMAPSRFFAAIPSRVPRAVRQRTRPSASGMGARRSRYSPRSPPSRSRRSRGWEVGTSGCSRSTSARFSAWALVALRSSAAARARGLQPISAIRRSSSSPWLASASATSGVRLAVSFLMRASSTCWALGRRTSATFWPVTRSITCSMRRSRGVTSSRARPSRPARPVRPMRCT
ncbi:hypothetical protein FQZ97_1029060 [compost metagenome]